MAALAWERERATADASALRVAEAEHFLRESAIHSVLTGGVSPMVLKDCARAAWSHPPGQVVCWLG